MVDAELRGSVKSQGAEAAAAKGAAAIGTAALEGTAQIISELLRASAANPIMAAATIIILTDILQQKNVITPQAATNLNNFVEVLTGIDVIAGVFKQSVTTLAYGADAATSAGALLGLLA